MNLCLKYGLVCDIQPGFAKVSFDDDDFVTDWMPVLVRKSKSDKESWQLEINEHVVCLMLYNCDDGVIIGAVPSDQDTPDPGESAGKFRKLFSDGTLIEYDKIAHKLTVDVKGDLRALATGKISVQATGEIAAQSFAKATVQAPVINLIGNVIISGSLSAASIATTGGGSITADGNFITSGEVQAGEVKAGGISLKTHKHAGVQTGTGTTGTPI